MAIDKLDKTFLTKGEDGYEDTTGWSKDFGNDLVTTVNALIDGVEANETNINTLNSNDETINDSITSINSSITSLKSLTSAMKPSKTTIAEIDKSVFGIYDVNNDEDSPVSGSVTWYTIINIPSNQGTSYSKQIAISHWIDNYSESGYGNGGIYIKKGSMSSWRKISFDS